MSKLSVVVPIYKGEKFIRKNLEIMKQALAEIFIDYEIIAVIDGQIDASYEEAMKVKGIKIVGYKHNVGKGFALKFGYQYITGDIITFIDSDMDLHPKLLKQFLPYLATADMIIGSKRHPFSKINYSLLRRVLSSVYHFYTNLVLGVKLRDTQSGIKLFKKEVLDVILPLIMVKGFAFDVELCFLAQKHGFRVVEAPINIEYQGNGSTLDLKAAFLMLLDTTAIRFRYSVLKKYQKLFWEANYSWPPERAGVKGF